MAHYSRGREDEVDDFDEYDPTPYGGGYDIVLTYGRPLPPSNETCYLSSSSPSDDFDYGRPQYSSYAEPSAYRDEALETEYSSYARPKPRPALSPPGGGQFGGGGYGFPSSGVNKPGHGAPDYGSERPGSQYGSGYDRKSEYGQTESEYGRKSEYAQAESEYGSGYGRKSEYGKPNSQEYGSGYGRKTDYETHESEYGSGYGRKPEYEAPSSEYGSGYGRKQVHEEEQGGGGFGYGGRSERPRDDPPRRPSYGRSGEESFERRDEDDDDDDDSGERRKHGYGEESYGRKKYVSISVLQLTFLYDMFTSNHSV